jgi:hypothetical protein
MLTRWFLRLGLLCLAGAWAVRPLHAEDIVFPADSGVVDVSKPPYGAVGDGRTDVTAALQQALIDHPNQNRIIYLPNGTYLISTTLRWPGSTNLDTRFRATILQGQSRAGTVIRLMDYAPGFGNAGHTHPMIWTGERPDTRVRNAIRNLTIHTGTGNPGTTAIQFMANRQGGVRDVTLTAGGKGDGGIGLDLSHTDENGPSFFKNLRIEGFDFGVRTAYAIHGATFENLELVGQREAGLRNNSQSLSIRHLFSTNSVAAIENGDGTGVVVLLDSVLQGLTNKRPVAAIMNKGFMFARDIKAPGYPRAIDNRGGSVTGASGPEVREFVSHTIFSLFPSPQYSLNLPVLETPELPFDTIDQWVSPLAFGGMPSDHKDDTQAIQKAIDSGKSTLYLPNGTWVIRDTVVIRGNIHRIIGCEARINADGMRDKPAFLVDDAGPPVVVIERLECEPAGDTLVEHASNRTLVLSSCLGARGSYAGTGKLFLEDVSSTTPWHIGTNQTLFARQLTVECGRTHVHNEGGLFWALGLKGELPGTLLRTSGRGKSEILGGLCESTGGWKDDPMFKIEDASATIILPEASFNRTPYQSIVSEKRGNVTKLLSNVGNVGLPEPNLPTRVGGIVLPLYAGYEGRPGIPLTQRPNTPAATNAPTRAGTK